MAAKICDAGTPAALAAATTSTWNWRPPVPLAGVPWRDWPPRPLAAVKWPVAYFFKPTDRLLFLLFALFVGLWLLPVSEAQAVLGADWLLQADLRNALALALVAGGLRLWLHTFRGQGSACEIVLPSHPVHMLFVLFRQLLGAPSGPSGFDAVSIGGRRVLALDAFFHHLHHRYFECSYGSGEFPLDRWLGTRHDGSEEATTAVRARKRVRAPGQG